MPNKYHLRMPDTIPSLPVWGAAAAAVAGATGALLWRGINGRSSQLFGPSVYRGESTRRSLALTFDDGPSEGTVELLDYLASQGVPATFFACGMNVLQHPDVARRVREAGHEIGNHTFSHSRLCPRLGWKLNLKSPAFIFEEFARTQAIIHDVTGAWPTLLRAPYGMRWYGMRTMQRRLGLLGVMWTVIGHDWEWPAERIAETVLQHAAPGGIICLHDGRDVRPKPDITETLAAVRQIVPTLRALGYHFETVTSLLRQTKPVRLEKVAEF